MSGRCRGSPGDRRVAVGGLRDDHEVGLQVEQGAEGAAGQRLVIGEDEHPDGHGGISARSRSGGRLPAEPRVERAGVSRSYRPARGCRSRWVGARCSRRRSSASARRPERSPCHLERAWLGRAWRSTLVVASRRPGRRAGARGRADAGRVAGDEWCRRPRREHRARPRQLGDEIGGAGVVDERADLAQRLPGDRCTSSLSWSPGRVDGRRRVASSLLNATTSSGWPWMSCRSSAKRSRSRAVARSASAGVAARVVARSPRSTAGRVAADQERDDSRADRDSTPSVEHRRGADGGWRASTAAAMTSPLTGGRILTSGGATLTTSQRASPVVTAPITQPPCGGRLPADDVAAQHGRGPQNPRELLDRPARRPRPARSAAATNHVHDADRDCPGGELDAAPRCRPSPRDHIGGRSRRARRRTRSSTTCSGVRR